MTNRRSTMRGLLLAALMLIPLAASAQPARLDGAERLQRGLDLTDTQVDLVENAVGAEAGAGDLWRVAAALAPTLTAEQKEKLFARPERKARGERPRRGLRGERGLRGGRPDRMQRDRPDPEERPEWRDEMQTALNLTDAQVQQLDALRAEKKAEREAMREELRDADPEARREALKERRADRPEPGEVPAEIAAILTPDQQDIFAVHHALGAHVLRHRMQR